jgi:hypothetical protein
MSVWSKIFSNWTWHNKDTARDTPLSAQNMQKLNDAIDTIDTRVVDLHENPPTPNLLNAVTVLGDMLFKNSASDTISPVKASKNGIEVTGTSTTPTLAKFMQYGVAGNKVEISTDGHITAVGSIASTGGDVTAGTGNNQVSLVGVNALANGINANVGTNYSSQYSLDSRVTALEQGGGGGGNYVKNEETTGDYVTVLSGRLKLYGSTTTSQAPGTIDLESTNNTVIKSNSGYISVNAPNSNIYESAKEIILNAKTSALNDPAASVIINSASGLEGILLEEKVTLATLADDEALITFDGRYGSSGNVYREGRIEVHGWSAEDDHSTTEIYQDSATERLVVNGDVEITNSLEVEEIIGSFAGTDLNIGVIDSVNIRKQYNSSTSSNTGGNLTVEGIITVNGSDYAEKFESIEDCPVGRFVTLDGEKIRLAQPSDDYILGVTSEKPAIVGDKDNPGTPVGLVGKLWVEHDGTAEVNGYVCCGKDGIATVELHRQCVYRVMAVDGNRCKILVK